MIVDALTGTGGFLAQCLAIKFYFTSDSIRKWIALQRSDVVVSNPPFGDSENLECATYTPTLEVEP